MMTNEELNGAIRQEFQNAQTILIVSHIRPDGDAVGSLLGLGLALQEAGKQVRWSSQMACLPVFASCPAPTRCCANHRENLLIWQWWWTALTCSARERPWASAAPDINIDHHITNLNFARINLVCPDAQATCGILAENLEAWGLPVSEKIAKALLTGLVSDTIGFRTSNVTANTLRLAAWLMDHGANLADLYNRAIVRRSFEAAQYWGQGLSHIQRSGRMVWTTLSLKDREIASYNGNDDADLVNVISAIDESDIGLIFVEQHDNHVKVSWRAQPGWDVSQIALQFGGGGHPAASGADIPGTLAEVQARVLEATRQILAVGDNGKNGQSVQENQNTTLLVNSSLDWGEMIMGDQNFDLKNAISGVLVVDKPIGLTSHDVVQIVRKGTNIRRAGHTGTLDPRASGVLVILIGPAVRLSEYVSASDKRYQAVVRLGVSTDTYDADGRVESTSPVNVTEEQFEDALKHFVGEIEQVPPPYSAVKIKGRKAYEMAREGEEVDLSPRKIQVYNLELLEWAMPEAVIDVYCSSGTYVRSLAHDLGESSAAAPTWSACAAPRAGVLPCVMPFRCASSKNILITAPGTSLLIPAAEALSDWPAIELTQEQVEAIRHGHRIPAEPGVGKHGARDQRTGRTGGVDGV